MELKSGNNLILFELQSFIKLKNVNWSPITFSVYDPGIVPTAWIHCYSTAGKIFLLVKAQFNGGIITPKSLIYYPKPFLPSASGYEQHLVLSHYFVLTPIDKS